MVRKKKVSKKSNNLIRKINQVFELEKRQLKEQKKIYEMEKEDLKGDDDILALERKQLRELADLEKLERRIERKVTKRPLTKVTFKDLGKAAIGAFIAIVSHFTILKGVYFAEEVSVFSASSFFVFSFFIGLIMIYYTGFRKVKQIRLLAVLPLRLIIIYLVTIFMVVLSLSIFGLVGHEVSLYKQVGVMMLPAIIGACAADLIGED